MHQGGVLQVGSSGSALRPSIVLPLTILAGFLWWADPSDAVVGYQTPFTSEQCGMALEHAQRLLDDNPGDLRASMVHAEALLCAGQQDDPEALDQAAEGFRQILARDPNNFFAYLYLAEATRARFSFSNAAIRAFMQARSVLSEADVGAARASLDAYIAQTIREVREQQQHFAQMIYDTEATLAAGTASSHQVGQLLMIQARTGPEGLERAAVLLDAYVAAGHRDPILKFYRAEMLRGRLARPTLAALYQAAEPYLCAEGGDFADRQACPLARLRLQQLGGVGQ